MNLSKAMGVISVINDFGNLFQLATSAVSYLQSRWKGTNQQNIQEAYILQKDLQLLSEILPAMYNLIDRTEWMSHEECVTNLHPKLMDAVSDAEDLLDQLRSYEQKVIVEGNMADLSFFIDFFSSVIHGSFNKAADILKRLNNLSSLLQKMGVHETPPRFDKSIRPETTSFCTNAKLFGREEELLELIMLLGVPVNNSSVKSKRKRTRREAFSSSTSRQHSINISYNEETIASVPVLTIVGIGGVGKSTIVQNITNHPQVKSHFELIIWICVSDGFDVKRLTKQALQSSSGKEAITDHLDSLQRALANVVNKRRFLLILDDMWDDALKGNGQCWNEFRAPFTDVLNGSMMLVTTRSQKVADRVSTMDAFPLEGLKDDLMLDFFKQCVFGSDSCNIEPKLEHICRSILPKLSGSPLAAKTLGHLLQDNKYWDIILRRQLWELRQEKADILPVLRLSYIYLPFHLKRCFSFCAVYPKGYEFEKHGLAEIWVAEGFVEPQDDIPAHDIACQYFEDLVNHSFFQMVQGKYVIHNLMHDMAKLISKDYCFIIKNVNDFQKVPQNVRHLSILANNGVECSILLGLSKHTKLRTLLCNKSLKTKISTSVMDCWFNELQRMRVIRFASTSDLPESISNMKHLRYLEISNDSTVKTLPSAFCGLYNLEIFYARKCRFENFPSNFGKLINLQKFESQIFQYHRGCTLEIDVAASEGLEKLRLTNSLNQFRGDMTIYNLGAISKDHAAEAEIKKKEYLYSLTLLWSLMRSSEQNDLEVFEALHPPINLRHLDLEAYLGESLPSWFHPQNLPNLKSLRFCYCNGLKRISFSNKDSSGSSLSSLTELSIERCKNLSSLEQFLQPDHFPAIVKITIEDCQRLVSLPTARFGEFHCLEELRLSRCPNINSRCLSMPSLKKLELINSGTLSDNIICCSLTYLCLSSSHLTSIQLDMWNLPVLQKLKITGCDSLISIGQSKCLQRCGSSIQTLSSLTDLTISNCKKLQTLDDLLTHEYLPSIERIHISCCEELRSLPGERFESFSDLKGLKIWKCSRINWQSGMLLPPSLKRLVLGFCRDFPAWFPCCLENLTSLKSLVVHSCIGIVSIPDHLWSSTLVSLQELSVRDCPDLVTVGGANEIASIKNVLIVDCPKLRNLSNLSGQADFHEITVKCVK